MKNMCAVVCDGGVLAWLRERRDFCGVTEPEGRGCMVGPGLLRVKGGGPPVVGDERGWASGVGWGGGRLLGMGAQWNALDLRIPVELGAVVTGWDWSEGPRQI